MTVVLIFVVGASTLLITRLNAASQQAARISSTASALASAKDALLGYAMTYAETRPGQPQGYLPCPDFDGNGSADTCAAVGQSATGRLPWRTLGLPPLRDGTGQCLWYALSGSYKNNPKTTLTSDTDGQFVVETASGTTIAGATSSGRAIAIIFAPGQPIGSQVRGYATPATLTECGSTNSADAISLPANYLDALNGVDNAQGTKSGATGGAPGSDPLPTATPSVFVSSPQAVDASANVIFNDVLLIITPNDFRNVYVRMDKWIADRARACLDDYAADVANGGRYPWAAALNGSSPPAYDDDIGERFGRIPDNLDDTATVGMLGAWKADPDPAIPAANFVPNTADPYPVCFDKDLGTMGQDWYWWWWNKWREMVSFAVDDAYKPGGSGSGAPTLTLDSVGAKVAVIVAGRTLSGQTRAVDIDKGSISNYLEGDNVPGAGAGNVPPGDELFINAQVTPTFNDAACKDGGCP
ncbi:MAG: hypothetical protein L0Z68_03430 [Gammaproteobacteria bacterium]|nr:hypothetical protein [Gammaproteobacteria bacterium]